MTRGAAGNELAVGVRVTYEPTHNDSGPIAHFVRPAGGARGAPPPAGHARQSTSSLRQAWRQRKLTDVAAPYGPDSLEC